MTQIPKINTVLELINKFPDANNYTSREVYSRDVYEFFQAMGRFTANEITFKDELNNAISKMNIASGEINSLNTNVNNKEASATQSATTATTEASEASSSATSALASKNAAKTSETNASASEVLAGKWANENENIVVQSGKYSAKHYALKAEGYMTNALVKQNNLSDLTNKATARTNLELGNVNNTSDANKPISTATQTALSTKINKSEIAYSVNTSSFIPNTLTSGAIIERGSNANGEYVKFADGTLICTHRYGRSIDAGVGVNYNWFFPHSFSTYDSWRVIVSGGPASPDISKTVIGVNMTLGEGAGINTANKTQISFYNGYGGTSSMNAELMAIGKWK